jgi:transcriptional regulator with XRE-family HTH domain
MLDNIGTRIKALRQALDLTQEQFASQIGLSRNYIAMIEIGQRDPSKRSISDICRVFGVDLIWLRTGAGEMFKPRTREEELAEIFARVQIEDDDKSRLIRAMAQLPDEAFPVFVKYIEKLHEILSEDK